MSGVGCEMSVLVWLGARAPHKGTAHAVARSLAATPMTSGCLATLVAPIAAVPHHHKCRGSKQYTFMVLEFVGQKSATGLPKLKSRCLPAAFLSSVSRGQLVAYSLGLLAEFNSLWL